MRSEFTIEAYLLAAGESSRMGTPKPMLAFGKTTVFERMVDSLRQGGIKNVRIIGRKDDSDLAQKAADLHVRYIVNADTERGMAGSILEAVEDCISTWMAVCPADLPLIKPSTVAACLHGLATECSVVQPICQASLKHPVFIHSNLRRELRQALQHGVILRDFLRDHRVAVVEVDDPRQFEDMDTPQQYHRLLAELGFGRN